MWLVFDAHMPANLEVSIEEKVWINLIHIFFWIRLQTKRLRGGGSAWKQMENLDRM